MDVKHNRCSTFKTFSIHIISSFETLATMECENETTETFCYYSGHSYSKKFMVILTQFLILLVGRLMRLGLLLLEYLDKMWLIAQLDASSISNKV